MKKGLLLIIMLTICIIPLLLMTCAGKNDIKPKPKSEPRPQNKTLTSFSYQPIKRKLLIIPIKGKGNQLLFQEIHTAIRNTLDNQFIVVDRKKTWLPTKDKKKLMRYCAKAEADLVLVSSYVKHKNSFIFNTTVYAFEDQGAKRISRAFSGKEADFVAKLTDFLNDDISPSIQKRYPKVYKGIAPSGVRVLDETPGGFPDWISNIPSDKDYQYFVGEVGGMADKKRAHREAINEALWNIALSVEALVEGVVKQTVKAKTSSKTDSIVNKFKSDLRISTRVTLKGAQEVKVYYRLVQLPDQSPLWEYHVLMRYPKQRFLQQISKVADKTQKRLKKKKNKKFKIAKTIIKRIESEFIDSDDSLTKTINAKKSTTGDYAPSLTQKSNNNGPYNSTNRNEMHRIPGGRFISGKDKYWDDNDPKKRKIKTFYLDKYEVTVADYEKEMGRLPDREPEWGWQDNHPVVNITWHEARDYCAKQGKRLPTEWEWEYAAGGPKHYTWPFGNEFNENDYCYNKQGTCPVGSYKANGFGLYDMGGNVWEWTQNRYNKNRWVSRGGSWLHYLDSADLRVSLRYSHTPNRQFNIQGFRCAK